MIEIERKFLVPKHNWPHPKRSYNIRQGYLVSEGAKVCRIRQKGDDYYLSLKARIDDIRNYDFEYRIPAADGITMLDELCEREPLSKTRHEVEVAGMLWEVDEFFGANRGLVVAEIEMPSVDTEFDLPEWLGVEVTDDLRYRNSNLYLQPWSDWSL